MTGRAMMGRSAVRAILATVTAGLVVASVGTLVNPDAEGARSDRPPVRERGTSPPAAATQPSPRTPTTPDRTAAAEVQPSPEPGPDTLPGGWSEMGPPVVLEQSADGALPLAAESEALAFERHLVVADAGRWTLHKDALPRRPEALAVGRSGGTRWVVATSGSRITLFDGHSTQTIEGIPEPLWSGALGAAWRGDGFVIVARPDDRGDGNPSYLLDPWNATIRELGAAPLDVNAPRSADVVAIDGAVLLVGAHIGEDSRPARETLGAAALRHGRADWSLVPGGVLSPQPAAAVAVGDHAVVIDDSGQAARLTAEGWTPAEATGLAPGHCGPEVAASDGVVLVIACHQAALLDVQAGTWSRIVLPLPNSQGFALTGLTALPDGFAVGRAFWDGPRVARGGVLQVRPAETWPLLPGSDGQRLAAPPGWQVAQEDLTPELDWPAVTASTAAMPVGSDGCDMLPTAAIGALGPGDALVSIQRVEGRPAESWMPQLGAIGRLGREWSATSFVGCDLDLEGLRLYWIAAQWSGDHANVLIVHHRDASEALIEEALGVANSWTWR